MEQQKLFEVDDDDDYGTIAPTEKEEISKTGLAELESSQEYTLEEAVEHFGFGRFQIRLGLSVGLTLVADAAQLLAPAIFGTVLECTSWKLSKVKVAWLTTIVFLGMITFCPFVGWVIDKFGRKLGILLTLVFGAIFASFGSFSPTYPWLLASRFCVGAALAASMQVFGYMEEFLPVGHRRRAMLTQLFWPFGGIWASGFGLLMIYHLKVSWMWYLLVMSVPFILTIAFLICLPESVRFLGALGHFHKVGKILTNIGTENKTGLPKGNFSRACLTGSSETGSTESSEKPKKDETASFKGLVTGGNLKSTLILSVLWFGAGFGYYGIVLLVTTYKTRGQPSKACEPMEIDGYTDLIWTGFAELPGTMVAFYALEMIGRKKTIIIQFLVVAASLVPFLFTLPRAAYVASLLIGRSTAQGIISALVIYTPEVYPTSLRGKGIGVTTLFFRLGGMATPFFSQVTVHDYFELTIATYLGVCCLGAIIAFFLPKETQGRELEN